MAFSKSVAVGNLGINGVYWRIANVTIERRTPQIHIEVLGYQSQASRDAGDDSIPGAVYRFEIILQED